MQLEGTFHNGVIVPDDPTSLTEGTRVRIEPVPAKPIEERSQTFAERFGDLIIDDPGLPTDLASQHEHYRLGTQKR